MAVSFHAKWIRMNQDRNIPTKRRRAPSVILFADHLMVEAEHCFRRNWSEERGAQASPLHRAILTSNEMSVIPRSARTESYCIAVSFHAIVEVCWRQTSK